MNQQATTGSIGAALSRLWGQVVDFLPTLLAAALTVLAGWLVARLLRWLATRLIDRLARLAPGRAVEGELRASGVERLAAEAVGRVVFWAVFLFSLAVAGEVLGLDVISSGLSGLAGYLPSVLAAVLVVIAGIVLGNLARNWIVGATARARISYGELAGQTTRGAIWLVAGVVALDQIGIESALLILTVGILVGTAVGSAALAFALGSRETVGNFIAVHYLGQSYRIGDTVRSGEFRGKIVEFTRTAVVLDTPEGRALVPASEFGGRASVLLREEG